MGGASQHGRTFFHIYLLSKFFEKTKINKKRLGTAHFKNKYQIYRRNLANQLTIRQTID